MAEATNTLQNLRRKVCKELQMPFFKKYGSAQTVDAGSTTTTPVDAVLTQGDDYWNGNYFYRVDSQESRQILDFVAATDTLTLEYALSTLSTDDSYEIHSIWNAYDIHEAINRAIEQGAKSFPETISDKTLVLEEDKLAYTISGLTNKPWRVSRIAIERGSNAIRGTASSGAATTLTDSSLAGSLSDVNSNWKISIYKGTGSGQIRDVSSVDNTIGEVTVSSAWDTNPSTDSKYTLWNPSSEEYDWYGVDNVYFDAKEYPDTLYFRDEYSSLFGFRIRIDYLSTPTSLSAEADTTPVNVEYIIAKAVSILHGQMVGDSRYNRELHYGEHVRYNDAADELLKRYRIDLPDFTRWVDRGVNNYHSGEDNPLNWGG